MAPRKSLYEASTQFQHWRHSPEQLGRIRESLNAAAVEAIRRTIESDEACLAVVSSVSSNELLPARVILERVVFDARGGASAR